MALPRRDHESMTIRKTLIPLCIGLLCLVVPSAASAQNTVAMPFGKDVRVVFKSGARVTGKLVDLTATEVVVREKRSTRRHALADVKSIETRTHAAKTLSLIGTGVAISLSARFHECEVKSNSWVGNGEPNCISPEPFLYAVGGAAIGAVIGGLIDQSKKRFLYIAPPGSVMAVPVVAPDRVGARIVIRW
jgi:hypothetical protein